MARLRAPDGCPWDLEQTFDSIKRHTLEETYEVFEAIEDRDWPALCEELGDLLLQPVFYSQMAVEAGLFNVEDALRSINEKLIRRHPHIFGDVVAEIRSLAKQGVKVTLKPATDFAPPEELTRAFADHAGEPALGT